MQQQDIKYLCVICERNPLLGGDSGFLPISCSSLSRSSGARSAQPCLGKRIKLTRRFFLYQTSPTGSYQSASFVFVARLHAAVKTETERDGTWLRARLTASHRSARPPLLQMASCEVFAKPCFLNALPLNAVLIGTLASVPQNVASLQIVAKHRRLPCVHSVLLYSSLSVFWHCFQWQVWRQTTGCCARTRACASVRVLPPSHDTVTADPGRSAITADEAGLPWQRLGRLVARWRDITAGLCNNLS